MTADENLREHVVRLLSTPWAHVTLEDGLSGIPPGLRGARPPGHLHTPWQLLEHVRLCQDDIVGYSRDPSHVSPDFPDGYWPRSDVPEGDDAWRESVTAVRGGLREMVALVRDPSRDLLEPFAWSDQGHTLLREAMVRADHNAYHLGQLVQLKKALGVVQDAPW